MKLIDLIKSDLKANPTAKSRFVLVFFRISHATLEFPTLLLPLAIIIRVLYRLMIDWLIGIDIPVRTKIGPSAIIYHGFGLVINPTAVIGSNCILRHGVTIGNKIVNGKETASPIIGDFVEFGANASIIGPITIGNHCIIGANTVLTKSIPDHTIAVGCSARILKND